MASMCWMRGVSSVIAAVILVAVTVAAAIAFIGYATGLFSAASGSTVQLIIAPDSYINLSDVDLAGRPAVGLHLHVINKGGEVFVDKIVVEASGDVVTRFYLVDHDMGLGDAYRATHGVVTAIIPSGADAWAIAQISGNGLTAGGVYTVKIYTKSGAVVTALLPAKK